MSAAKPPRIHIDSTTTREQLERYLSENIITRKLLESEHEEIVYVLYMRYGTRDEL